MTVATESQELTIMETILVPPPDVYAMFTTEAGWLAWCCEEATIDARLGGTLHIYTEGYNAYGEFKVLDPSRFIAFTWDGDGEPPTLVRVQLDPRERGTRVLFHVTGLGSQEAWKAIAEFLERIWGRALGNLKRVLEAGSQE
jgi:uncharacterized protein YndB with AHSA1/START domain